LKTIELRLIHDGKLWIAQNGSLTASAKTLKDLDLELAKIVRASEQFAGEQTLAIRMNFDNVVIPEWIRQYSNHYFNRVVTINIKGTK